VPGQKLAQRLRDQGGDRGAGLARAVSHPGNQRRRQLDGEHDRRLRHGRRPAGRGLLRVAVCLADRDAEPVRHQLRTLGKRCPGCKAIRSGVDPRRVLASVSTVPATRHDINIQPFMSFLDLDTPRQLQPSVTQRDVKAEVAKCVGGVVSPLLANIALSVLDDHFTAAWAAMGDSSARHRRRRRGEATYRLVRYADDFVVLVHGTKAHAEQLRDQATVLAPMGLRLSGEKTRICHIDEGFDFLGFRIQRQPKRGSGKPFVYTWPTKKALCTVKATVRTATRQGLHQPLAVLLYRLAPILRGWTSYFRHGASKTTFDYLRRFTWRRVLRWLRRKHRRANWKSIQRRHLPGWWPTDGDVVMFDPGKVTVSRYRYRGNIPTPWSTTTAA
jgi:hypothetical protein